MNRIDTGRKIVHPAPAIMKRPVVHHCRRQLIVPPTVVQGCRSTGLQERSVATESVAWGFLCAQFRVARLWSAQSAAPLFYSMWATI